MLPPSSEWGISSTLKNGAAGNSETFVSTDQSTRRHIAERSNLDFRYLLTRWPRYNHCRFFYKLTAECDRQTDIRVFFCLSNSLGKPPTQELFHHSAPSNTFSSHQWLEIYPYISTWRVIQIDIFIRCFLNVAMEDPSIAHHHTQTRIYVQSRISA